MNILVFDTETLGMTSQDLLNVGYRIVDLDMSTKTVKPLVERDYLVSSIFKGIKRLYNEKVILTAEMPCIMGNNFAPSEKVSKYDYLLEQKRIVSRELPTIYNQLAKDIDKYKPAFAYAYNCTFDVDKFQRSAEKFHIINPIENLPVYDIWAYATNYIVHTEDYIEWAMANKIFSASRRNLSSSVESVTKYLLDDLDFVEQHTALDDTQYELMILIECVKRGADITKKEKKMGYIPTGEIFVDKVVDRTTGECTEVEYKKKITKNGVTTYYN